MKRLLALALAGVMVFGVVGCGAKTEQAAPQEAATEEAAAEEEAAATEEAVVEEDAATEEADAEVPTGVKLVVATTCMTKPYSYYDDEEKPAGSEIDIWNEISARTGFEIEWYVADFAGITGAVDSGIADVASNALGYTEARAEKYQLSEPYMYQASYLCVYGDDDTINSIDDLDGKVYCCNDDTPSKTVVDEYCKAHNINVQYLYEATGGFMMEVNLRRADALCTSKVNYEQKMATGEFNLKLVGDPLYEEAEVFLFSKDTDPAIVDAVNKAVADMRADGTLGKILEDNLGVDLSSPVMG
ncbi:MAG: transporter substrate-binding domain-containing protein [Lachnospiraceae bacterium]|nr:transporter substrate-binding domain-containing protein [Lachnospiraceae bacterium]